MMMIEFLLATILTCSESEELIRGVENWSIQAHHKEEVIKTIKENTEKGCYEGSEYNS
jgi:hypothetical protein